jgi:hypothetical protein
MGSAVQEVQVTAPIPEGLIHVAVRADLARRDWRLLAGQYPRGSDDDLPRLNVIDPQLARDSSPDPRRHSLNKYVPDLVALKVPYVLVIEMKSEYSLADVAKLEALLGARRSDYVKALAELFARQGLDLDPNRLTHVPAVAYSTTRVESTDGCCHFVVSDAGVAFTGNVALESIE